MRVPAIFPLTGLAALLWCSSAPAQTVMLSELCDPRLNYQADRFIEIYNAGGSAVDLTGWSLVAVGNGADILTWNLSGTIDPGQALVAGDATTVTPFQVDFADENWSTANATWNGKVGDGARLVGPGPVVVDVVVATGTTFENEDYTRNPGVVAPNPTYTPAEWTAVPVDFPTEGTPGTHSTLPPAMGPIITNVLTDPLLPTSSDAVHVAADVADSAATILSVELFWGTAPDSITNPISMSLVSGDEYETDLPIPAQAAGTVVHFEVHASNDVPATTVLGFQSYDVPYEVTIPAIQGMAASSPYDGSTVITGGVATAVFGSYFVLQDGAGAWNGLWVRSTSPVSMGDDVTVRGQVTESDALGLAGNTLLQGVTVLSATPGGTLPAATTISSADLALEQYEGVLVQVLTAECTDANAGLGEWEIDDGSGLGRVGGLGYPFAPDLGTDYHVQGCATYSSGLAKLEPRGAGDVVWVADSFAPVLEIATATNDSTVILDFSEEVDPTTAETAGHYSIAGLTVSAATQDAFFPDRVALTVSAMGTGMYTVSVSGVEDLYGNVLVGGMLDYNYAPSPPGYYATAEGLFGVALQSALHLIIDDHTAVSYEQTWISFQTTDDKPNGKVWDMYSDVPGGTPPYEYTFGVDEGGVGGVEGTGYNREHSWPQSWFGGSVAPMRSDLFQLYPTDNYVNNQRGSFPFGETDSPTWTSLNGSRLGPCSYPGYTGTIFEPIDEYKGDLARGYFYMTTRYYTEDGAWPGSDMTDGAELLPWAVALLLDWHAQDPVSQKEIDRNGAVYAIQANRNPFIDRPEFAERMLSTAVAVGPALDFRGFELAQNLPNPFGAETAIGFSVPGAEHVRLQIYDVSGRRVAGLLDRRVDSGRHVIRWDGRNQGGAAVAPGVYFYRVEAGSYRETRRMVRVR